MTTSEQINELAAALAKAQGEMDGAKKDAANPFFKSKYADLASVRDACIPALSKHGIAVFQSPSAEGAIVSVVTLLAHSSGQWVRGVASCTAKDDSPQSVGSATTYLRRYSLQSFAGVAPEDDDAEAAQGRGTTRQMPVAAIPQGYDDWVGTLQTKVMPLGIDALKQTWKVAPSAYRDYLSKDGSRWEGMKAAAQAVTDTAKAKPEKVPA